MSSSTRRRRRRPGQWRHTSAAEPAGAAIGEKARTLNEPEQQYLEAFFRRIERNHRVIQYVVFPLIGALGLGGVLYTFLMDGFSISGIVLLLLISPLIAFGIWYGRKMAGTRVESEKPLRRVRGTIRPKFGASGKPVGLYIDDLRVSQLLVWPAVWHAPVEALVYTTNSGQHLLVELAFAEDAMTEEAFAEYEKNNGRRPAGDRFALADDVRAGVVDMDKNHYQLY